MPLQGQDDAVGDDRSQDHVLERSVRVKEQVISYHSHITAEEPQDERYNT